jgi:hypothetical protein
LLGGRHGTLRGTARKFDFFLPLSELATVSGQGGLHLQEYNVVYLFETSLKQEATGLLHAASFMIFRLIFGPEDGGDIFLRMSVDSQQNTRHYIQEDRNHHVHRCKNFKS